MKFSSYPINNLFNHDDSTLSHLITKALSIDKLNNSLKKILSPELSEQCRLGQYENGIMTLYIHSAAYATQMRFYVPDLLTELRQHQAFYGLKSIQVKIATYQPPEKVQPPVSFAPPIPLPPTQAEVMVQLAQGLSEPDDPATQKLAASLKRLARHGKVQGKS